MNPQPVSLADELRKLAAQITQDLQGDGFFKPMNASYVLGRIEGRLISALLAQHAVAEPRVASELVERITNYLSNGGLFNPELMEHDKVRELLIACRQQLFVAAHAAEQPKLTPVEVERILCGDVYDVNDEVDSNKLAVVLNRLLTSPVAPPPPRNDKREGAERTARLLCETRGHTGRRPCDFCQMQIDACLRETEPLRTCYCGTPKEPHCESVHAPPPVAPGEQPPQLIGQPLPVPASHGTQFGSDYQPLNAPEVMSAPLAQERPEDK